MFPSSHFCRMLTSRRARMTDGAASASSVCLAAIGLAPAVGRLQRLQSDAKMFLERLAVLAEHLPAHTKLPRQLLVGLHPDQFRVKVVADDGEPDGRQLYVRRGEAPCEDFFRGVEQPVDFIFWQSGHSVYRFLYRFKIKIACCYNFNYAVIGGVRASRFPCGPGRIPMQFFIILRFNFDRLLDSSFRPGERGFFYLRRSSVRILVYWHTSLKAIFSF